MTETDRPSRRWRTAHARPVVLAIGGFDPSGGAGVLADARAIAAAGAHPCALITATTVQSTAGCADVHAVDPEVFRQQLEHLVAAQPPAVVKLGALGDAPIASIVADYLADYTGPVLVDPVAIASVTTGAGRPLASAAAREIVLKRVLPRGPIVCANAVELTALSGIPCDDADSAALAARAILARGAFAVLAKGGHWSRGDATDVLVLASALHTFPAPRLDAADVHGTGCALASLLAGRLALLADDDERALVEAVRWAKGVLFRALEAPIVVGEGQRVLRIEQG